MFGLGINNLGGNNDEALAVAQGIISSKSSGYYNPNDFSGLFQDSGGTTPVTSVGDPVGLMLDTRRIRQYADNVLVLDGAAGDYASTPDSPSISVTSDVTCIAYVEPDDWTPSQPGNMVTKWRLNSRGFAFRLETTGHLRFFIGTSATSNVDAQTTSPTGFSGARWLRCTWDDSTDELSFYSSTDPRDTDYDLINWTAIETGISLVSTGIFDSDVGIQIGCVENGIAGTIFDGKIYRATVITSTDPTVAGVVDFNPQDKTADGSTWVSSTTGETWTQNGTARVVPDWSNYALQKTAGSRPLLGIRPKSGVRNLLNYSEEFDNAAWNKISAGTGSAPIVTPDFAKAPDGSISADRVQLDLNGGVTTSDLSYISTSGSISSVASIWLKTNDGSTVDITIRNGNNSNQIITITPSWQRFPAVNTSISDATFFVGLRGGIGTGVDDSVDLLYWGAQLEEGSTATAYQRKTANGFCWEDTRTRVNLLNYTEDLVNSYWTKSRVVITSNAAEAPDGSVTADKVSDDATPAQTHFFSNPISSFTGAQAQSVYIKTAGESRYLTLRVFNAINDWVSAIFDPDTGTVTKTGAGSSSTFTDVSSSMTDVGNGWYRCDFLFTGGSKVFSGFLTDSTTAGFAAVNGVPDVYDGDNSSGLFVWGCQYENGSTATTYQPIYGDWFNTLSDLAPLFSSHITRLVTDGVDDFMTIPGSASTFKFLHDGTGCYLSGAWQTGFVDNPDTLYTHVSSQGGLSSSSRGVSLFYDDRSSIPVVNRLRLLMSNGSSSVISVDTSTSFVLPNTVAVLAYSFDNSLSPDFALQKNGENQATSNQLATPSSLSAIADVHLFTDGGEAYHLAGAMESLLIVGNVPSPSSQQFLTKYLAEQSGITL